MIYDHPKDNGHGENLVIQLVWNQRDLGLICDAEVHLILGTWFNYPPCCIDAFIFDHTGGDIATDDRLGTYFHCKRCYETKKVLTNRKLISSIKGEGRES